MKHSIAILLLAVLSIGCGGDDDDNPTPDNEDGKLTIAAFAPLTAAHDSIVTITGTGFSKSIAANTVTLNGIAATVTMAGEKELKIKIPKNKDCTGALKVSVNGESVTAADQFKYQFTYVVTTLAGNNVGARKSLDGKDTDAKFFGPVGIAHDEAGILYITDELGHRVRRIGTDNVVTTLAGSDEAGYDDGPASQATFSAPYGITVSELGVIYLTDRGRHTVRKIQGGSVSTVAGGGLGFNDGSGATAKFDSPRGIAISNAGDVFVADKNNYRIRIITSGNLVSTLAGSSQPGILDGQGSSARLKGPTAVCVDKSGNTFIADSEVDFNAVRKITKAGVVTTIAGGPTFGYLDGVGSEAKFVEPMGIAVDDEGNLFITDKHRIRKVTAEGIVTTLAGGNTAGAVDGVGTTARFNGPIGIAVSSSGILYVADRNNDLIRKLIPE